MSSENISRIWSDPASGPSLVAVLGLIVTTAIGVAAGLSLPASTLFALLATPVVALVLYRPRFGLYLTVPAMMVSPEFTVGELPFRSVELRIEDGLIALMVLGLLRDRIVRSRPLSLPPIALPVGLFCATVVLSLANAIAFEDLHVLQSVLYTAKYVEYLVLFLLVPALVESRTQLRRLFVVFLAMAYVVTVAPVVEAVVHYTTPFTLGWEPYVTGGRTRFVGLYGNPTVLGAFVALVFPTALTTAFGARRRSVLWRLGVAVSLVAVPALLLSAGRSPVVGSAVALATLVGFTTLFGDDTVLSRSRAVVVSIAGVTATSLFVVVGNRLGIDGAERLMTLVAEPWSIPGIGSRIDRWTMFLRTEFASDPLLGSGAATAPWFSSYYVRLLVEAGVLSLVAFLVLVAAVVRTTVVVARETSGLFNYLAVGALGGIAGFLTINLTAEMLIVTQTAQTFWVLMGLVVAARQLNGGRTITV